MKEIKTTKYFKGPGIMIKVENEKDALIKAKKMYDVMAKELTAENLREIKNQLEIKEFEEQQKRK